MFVLNTLDSDVYTDKARYNPGDTAQIFVNLVNANAATRPDRFA